MATRGRVSGIRATGDDGAKTESAPRKATVSTQDEPKNESTPTTHAGEKKASTGKITAKKDASKQRTSKDDGSSGMITVRGRVGEGQIAVFDVSKNHDGGQVTIKGKAEAKVWPTAGIMRAIREGRIEEV